MADRVISEQAVLEAICHDKCGLSPNRCISGISGECVQIKPIKAVPSADKWIPMSEKMPEEFKSVLVCYKSQGGMAQCVSERLVNMDGSNRWSALGGQEPIAWMPLPEPYEPQEISDRNLKMWHDIYEEVMRKEKGERKGANE